MPLPSTDHANRDTAGQGFIQETTVTLTVQVCRELIQHQQLQFLMTYVHSIHTQELLFMVLPPCTLANQNHQYSDMILHYDINASYEHTISEYQVQLILVPATMRAQFKV